MAAGLLCLGLIRGLQGTGRAVGVTVAVVWAAAVGASRVYLGVHWPTDVLGGWLFGALLTTLAAVLLLGRLPAARSAARGSQRAEQQRESGHL